MSEVNRGRAMEERVNPEIGQWYLHRDKGEMFRVTAYDEPTHTIEIQTFDGDVDEIDEEAWSALPLELAEEPEDWTGPLDGIEFDDLKSDTEMTAADWAEPLQPFRPQEETWQQEDPEERSNSETGDSP
ncbi:MAG TPA: DUF6763 family protein [Steroidobacteraceae bacterium]|nr:DUF6763 family protein [Steroidobacteraceae bacterium]